MATMKDVAKMAGVSVGTVSNYLNHTRPVSKEVSIKIQTAVETLRYNPNYSAKSLRTSAYYDVGVILPNFDNPYYVQMFQGIESILKASSYNPLLAFSYDIPDIETSLLHSMMEKQIQGLILVPSQPTNWKFYYDNLVRANVPLVLIDRDVHGLDANLVALDSYALIRQVSGELLDNGYRSICFFSGPPEFENNISCAKGLQDAFRIRNLSVESSTWISANNTKEDAFRETLKLLQHTTPEAIIAASEALASGIIEALRVLGYSHNDLPVITPIGESWNLHTNPFTISIRVLPLFQQGKSAATVLLNQLNNPLSKEIERIVIRPALPCIPDDLKQLQRPPQLPEKVAPQRTLRILMMDTPQVHALTRILRNYEQQVHIKAEVTIIPHHQMYQTILDNCSSGSEAPFDVLMYDIPWLSELVSGGYLSDITEAVDSFASDLFLPNCCEYFVDINRRHYGIPFMYAPQILYYRKDLFENSEIKTEYYKQNGTSLRPPLSLKEYNAIANFFTNGTDAVQFGIAFPAAYDECLAPEIYMRLLTCGGSLFDHKGEVCLRHSGSLTAYVNLLRSIRVAKPDYRTSTDTSIVQDFLRGETAMLVSYPSFMCDAADLQRNTQIGTIGYHRIPASSPVLGGWSLGISSRSTQQEEAVSFLKWLCDDQISTYFTLMGGQTAIIKNYTNDELTKLYPWLSLYYDSYPHCKPLVPPRLGNRAFLSQRDIDAAVCKWVYRLMDNEIDAMEAIEATHDELKILLHNAQSQQPR